MRHHSIFFLAVSLFVMPAFGAEDAPPQVDNLAPNGALDLDADADQWPEQLKEAVATT